MNKSKAIMKFCEKNTKPVQSLCPEFNQYFKTSKGYEVWNSKTGKREPFSYNARYSTDYVNSVSVRSSYEGFYVRYIKELDCLEFAKVWINGGRGQNGIKKEWSYYNYTGYNDGYCRYNTRVFVFRNDSNGYLPNGKVLTGKKYYCNGVISILKTWGAIFTDKENYREIKKYDSSINLSPYGWYGMDDDRQIFPMWIFIEWYTRGFMSRHISKLSSTLADYELGDIHDLAEYDKSNAIYYQKLDDNYSVLRVFYAPWSWNSDYSNRHYSWDNPEEVCRLFISSKGKPTVMANERGKWIIKSSTPWKARHESIIINPSELYEFNPLKYIMPCINSKENMDIQTFINILRHPIIEQMYKAGYPKLAKDLLNDSCIKARLRDCYLVEKETKQPLYKLLKVNRFVLNAAEKYGNPYFVAEIKWFIGNNDATKVGEDLCNNIADYIKSDTYKSVTDLIPSQLGHIFRYSYRYRRNHEYDDPLNEAQIKWVTKLFNMEKKRQGCINLYVDLCNVYERLIHKPEIDLTDVHNWDDIYRLHENLVNLQVEEERERIRRWNMEEEERNKEREKTFNKLQKNRIAKFEYEDDEFCVRVPHELCEITTEGCILHHCVGGYLDRHANGYTNILFLRRKENEENPFYTIEIDNNNHVVQIHGKNNKWLGNNPEAIPFVYEYLEAIGANYDINLLLNKATGYSPSNDRLDEKYLKRNTMEV